MEALGLTGNQRLVAAIIFGVLCGVWLVKSELDNDGKVSGTLLMKEPKCLQVFLLSISFGLVIFYICHSVGLVNFHLRPVSFQGALFGGLISGIGLAVCGRIPVAALSSLAGGKLSSLWVLIGCLLAFPVFRGASGIMSKTIYSGAGNMTRTGINETVMVMVALVCLALACFIQFMIGGGESGGGGTKKGGE